MRKIIVFSIFIALVLASPLTIFATEKVVITAQELYRAATQDPKAAEALYLGKTMSIRGVVVATGISRYLTPTVTLSSHNGGPEMIICVLPRLDAGKLSDFTPGQTVTFSGRIHRVSERVVVKESKAVE